MNKTIRVFTYTLAARSSLARSYGSPARRSRPAHGLTLRTKWLQNNTITHSASGPRRPAHERDDPSLPGAAMLFSHFFFSSLLYTSLGRDLLVFLSPFARRPSTGLPSSFPPYPAPSQRPGPAGLAKKGGSVRLVTSLFRRPERTGCSACRYSFC